MILGVENTTQSTSIFLHPKPPHFSSSSAMAAPKRPKKSKAGKKSQIEKLIKDAEKRSTEDKKLQNQTTRKPQKPYKPLDLVIQPRNGPVVHVRLPAPPVKPIHKASIPRPLEPKAPLISTLQPIQPRIGHTSIPVWLPKAKPFPFLKLPTEIRVKIYVYFFKPEHYKIQFISNKAKALTYTLPDRPRSKDPKVPESAKRRRRQFDYPRRIRSKETDMPTYELMPGPCSLLLAHPKIGYEAAEYFYKIQAFSFSSCRVLNAFMNMLPASSKLAITDVRLTHYTAGYPKWNWIEYWHEPSGEIRRCPLHRFKVANDILWEQTLWRLSDEMLNIEKFSLNETINEIPMEVHEDAIWRVPLSMALAEMPKMRKVDIKFFSYHADDAVLEVDAYKLAQELLAEPYRDSNDAIEYVSDSSKPEKLIPPERRAPVKCIRLVMPGYERPLY